MSGGLIKSAYNFGEAINFNASVTNQYGLITNVSTTKIPNEFTIIVWFRFLFGTMNFTARTMAFLSSFIDFSNLHLLRINLLNNNTWQVLIFNRQTGKGAMDSTSVPIPYDQNVHCLIVTQTRISSTDYRCKVTVDGIERLSYTDGGPVDYFRNSWGDSDGSFFTVAEIGRDLNSSASYYKGLISEFDYLPRSLTSAERTAYYNSKKGSTILESESRLIRYKFEGNGNDASGNSRTLTLFNAPTFQKFAS